MAINVYHDQIKNIIFNRVSDDEFLQKDPKESKKKQKEQSKTIEYLKTNLLEFANYAKRFKRPDDTIEFRRYQV
ncbi:MAG: hypothetical protein JWO40_124 [Candidatus Doudnabacteria bacterium]|nr:hypothetical protein [Candidatus Doudnabacteria bacterium]